MFKQGKSLCLMIYRNLIYIKWEKSSDIIGHKFKLIKFTVYHKILHWSDSYMCLMLLSGKSLATLFCDFYPHSYILGKGLLYFYQQKL